MMIGDKLDIYVFLHLSGMENAQMIGVLSAHQTKGRKTFSFEYERAWLASKERLVIDPDLQFYSGIQYPQNKPNFGIFLDSMPDTWGRTLMTRKAAQEAREKNQKATVLQDIDYLLCVYDESRMGALRFKTELTGPFLDYNSSQSTPPWSSLRELQYAAGQIEEKDMNVNIKKWLAVLLAPGSSLGGARPKANIMNENGELWIAKFPSKNDDIDKAQWEYLAYRLAVNAGIKMAPCRIEKVAGRFHTFFTKRFDREKSERIHFASAMTMTGKNEELIKDNPASYLDIAEFIQRYGINVEENLYQLWRRIVFNIAISNTDDHMRNHGFLLTNEGWSLSPAYDLNPSIDKSGLALNINEENNQLDIELAKSVGEFFRLDNVQMNLIIQEVLQSVKEWKNVANEIGISRVDQGLMEAAFSLTE